MRVADRLAQREHCWRELDALLQKLSSRPMRRAGTSDVLRLGELYRSACTDLMLAEAHDLPRDTVTYLHGLVGRAHNAVYRGTGSRFRDWGAALFGEVPRELRSDPAFRIAMLTFWGAFLICALLAAGRADFARDLLGDSHIDQMDEMYARADMSKRNDTEMAGFYINNNTSIGLQCFAWGLTFGIGTLYILLSNGMTLGTIFGHMATTPHAAKFFTFVTAHGPFELTAVVLAGTAGLRMGWGLIDTKGQSRLGSLKREATRALPILGAAVVLFFLAAFLEGFVSASSIPYPGKLAIALGSAVLLAIYIGFGGRAVAAPGPASASRP
jgi:uncharacterized membrane protein SpoIIM required for sporulation